MEAEFTKLKNSEDKLTSRSDIQFSDWLEQTYLTSGSLLANSCQSALLLVGHKETFQSAAYEFGKNLAITRQVRNVYVYGNHFASFTSGHPVCLLYQLVKVNLLAIFLPFFNIERKKEKKLTIKRKILKTKFYRAITFFPVSSYFFSICTG